MWPAERPGKANSDRSGEGERTQSPADIVRAGLKRSVREGVVPRSLSVVSKVWSLCGGLWNR